MAARIRTRRSGADIRALMQESDKLLGKRRKPTKRRNFAAEEDRGAQFAGYTVYGAVEAAVNVHNEGKPDAWFWLVAWWEARLPEEELRTGPGVERTT